MHVQSLRTGVFLLHKQRCRNLPAFCGRALLNDSYRTHLCLRHPPRPLALACMHVAGVLAQRGLQPWLQSLPSCDLDEVGPKHSMIGMGVWRAAWSELHACMGRFWRSAMPCWGRTAGTGTSSQRTNAVGTLSSCTHE